MTDKLIDESHQIERYGCTIKELEEQYGWMTPDELLIQAWSWAGDVVHGAKEVAGDVERGSTKVQDHILYAGNRIQWLIGTARKFAREAKT